MASLSNINGLFDVHSTGAILFSTSHGTSGQILRSNGNAAPTWVTASTVIGGPYLPLTGGTLSGATATASGISFTVGGALTGTSATFSGTVTTPQVSLSTASTTDSVLRLIDAGVIAYDWSFPDTGTLRLGVSASSNKTLLLQNSGIGEFNLSVDNNATFGGTVSGTGYSGPGQGLDNLLSLGAYATTPATTGILIATNIVTNNYAFIFGTIKLQRFHVAEKQTIEFSAMALNTGVIQSYQATSDVAITFKIFNYNGYWYLHFPMPAYYTTATAFINTGEGYQGQTKGFNEVSSISMNAVPSSGVTNSVDVISNVYLTTGTSSPWLKNGNDIYNSNSANVGIGEPSPKAKLNITGVSAGPAVPISTSSAGIIRIESGNGGQALDIGAQGASPYSMWLQVGNASNSTGDTYPILLNPLGGNVGIGTSSPTNKLHVHTDADNAYGIRIEGSTNNVAGVWTGLGIGGESSNTKSAILFEDTVGSYARGKLHLCVNNGANQDSATPADAKLTIIPNGNVGIGTAAPSELLEVMKDGGAIIRMHDPGNNSWKLKADTDFHIYDDSSSDYLTIKNSGNVGINITSPKAKLDVDGDVNTTGYNSNTLEFSTFFTSGSNQVIATLSSPAAGTTCVATIEYVALYNYGGTNIAAGIIMASTRYVASVGNTYQQVDDITISLSGNDTGLEPTLFWVDGINNENKLKINVTSSAQITARVRITYHDATLTRNYAA